MMEQSVLVVCGLAIGMFVCAVCFYSGWRDAVDKLDSANGRLADLVDMRLDARRESDTSTQKATGENE